MAMVSDVLVSSKEERNCPTQTHLDKRGKHLCDRICVVLQSLAHTGSHGTHRSGNVNWTNVETKEFKQNSAKYKGPQILYEK